MNKRYVLIAFGILLVCVLIGTFLVQANTPKEQEREITLAQLPAAAKATVLQEAGEHEILEVEEVRVEGQLYYEAEWLADGMEVEVQVGADGELLGREIEEPDGEDDDNDDDGDDDD